MEPQDVVKLLYQNEFGPGHLVTDPAACLQRLEDEYALVEVSEQVPLMEDIGNGLARVNLAGYKAKKMPLQDLAAAFMQSANQVKGEKGSFLEKLAWLKESYGMLPCSFTYEELEVYLTRYMAEGCPVVSHSETYRKAYLPSYRVVLKTFYC